MRKNALVMNGTRGKKRELTTNPMFCFNLEKGGSTHIIQQPFDNDTLLHNEPKVEQVYLATKAAIYK